MRTFILGGNQAYASSAADPTKVSEGAIAIFQTKQGTTAVTTDGVDVTEECNIVLGRTAANGGPVIIPFYPNHFSYTKMLGAAVTAFNATVTVPDEIVPGTYTLIVAEKGKGFNERNLYTIDTYVNSVTTTPAQVAEKLTKSLNDKVSTLGLKATHATDAKNFTIQDQGREGRDFEILLADNLSEGTVSISTHGQPAQADYKHIVDLANKAAADAGFNYTYSDKDVMYPTFPFGGIDASSMKSSGFTVFNLRFAEPRKVRTVDTLVHQIVQIALPTGAGAISTLTTIFDNIVAGASSAAGAGASTMELFDGFPVEGTSDDVTDSDASTDAETVTEDEANNADAPTEDTTEEPKVNLEDVVE